MDDGSECESCAELKTEEGIDLKRLLNRLVNVMDSSTLSGACMSMQD